MKWKEDASEGVQGVGEHEWEVAMVKVHYIQRGVGEKSQQLELCCSHKASGFSSQHPRGVSTIHNSSSSSDTLSLL